jgi:hypothetical protein
VKKKSPPSNLKRIYYHSQDEESQSKLSTKPNSKMMISPTTGITLTNGNDKDDDDSCNVSDDDEEMKFDSPSQKSEATHA